MVARAVVVIAAVAFVGNAAAARSVFGSNVCGLLSAHQVMVIRNVTAGIGSAAYEANGGSASGIHFALGTYVVAANVTGTGKPSWSDASVEALAKNVAAKLS